MQTQPPAPSLSAFPMHKSQVSAELHEAHREEQTPIYNEQEIPLQSALHSQKALPSSKISVPNSALSAHVEQLSASGPEHASGAQRG